MTTFAEQHFHALFESAPVFWKGSIVMSWKPEVTTGAGESWAGNALRFATETEAAAYVKNLAYRWTSVTKTRVVQCEDPVNHIFVDGQAKALPPAADKATEPLFTPIAEVTMIAVDSEAIKELLQTIAKELSDSAARAYGDPPTVRMAAGRLRDYVQGINQILERIS